MHAGPLELEPYAGLSSVLLHTGRYRESGDLSLDSGRQRMQVHYSTLGVRAGTVLPLGGKTVSLRAGAGWQRAFGDTTPTAAHSYDGRKFEVSGAAIGRDALLLEASFGVALTRDSVLHLDYQGSLAGQGQQHAAGLMFRSRF